MSDINYIFFVQLPVMIFLLFYEKFMHIKEKRKNKQLEADYNELLKQVVLLTDENTELKKERVQI